MNCSSNSASISWITPQRRRGDRRFLAQFPECFILATCRRHQNHGKFNGSIEEQFAVLDLAVHRRRARHRCRDRNRRSRAGRLNQFRGRAQLIISYHNFEATPPMDTVINRVMKIQADAYKIVTTARKPSDNVRVLALAKALPKQQLVVLAMGELGFPTRVLSPAFGGLYTYAAPDVRRREPPPDRSARASCATCIAWRSSARAPKSTA